MYTGQKNGTKWHTGPMQKKVLEQLRDEPKVVLDKGCVPKKQRRSTASCRPSAHSDRSVPDLSNPTECTFCPDDRQNKDTPQTDERRDSIPSLPDLDVETNLELMFSDVEEAPRIPETPNSRKRVKKTHDDTNKWLIELFGSPLEDVPPLVRQKKNGESLRSTYPVSIQIDELDTSCIPRKNPEEVPPARTTGKPHRSSTAEMKDKQNGSDLSEPTRRASEKRSSTTELKRSTDSSGKTVRKIVKRKSTDLKRSTERRSSSKTERPTKSTEAIPKEQELNRMNLLLEAVRFVTSETASKSTAVTLSTQTIPKEPQRIFAKQRSIDPVPKDSTAYDSVRVLQKSRSTDETTTKMRMTDKRTETAPHEPVRLAQKRRSTDTNSKKSEHGLEKRKSTENSHPVPPIKRVLDKQNSTEAVVPPTKRSVEKRRSTDYCVPVAVSPEKRKSTESRQPMAVPPKKRKSTEVRHPMTAPHSTESRQAMEKQNSTELRQPKAAVPLKKRKSTELKQPLEKQNGTELMQAVPRKSTELKPPLEKQKSTELKPPLEKQSSTELRQLLENETSTELSQPIALPPEKRSSTDSVPPPKSVPDQQESTQPPLLPMEVPNLEVFMATSLLDTTEIRWEAATAIEDTSDSLDLAIVSEGPKICNHDDSETVKFKTEIIDLTGEETWDDDVVFSMEYISIKGNMSMPLLTPPLDLMDKEIEAAKNKQNKTQETDSLIVIEDSLPAAAETETSPVRATQEDQKPFKESPGSYHAAQEDQKPIKESPGSFRVAQDDQKPIKESPPTQERVFVHTVATPPPTPAQENHNNAPEPTNKPPVIPHVVTPPRPPVSPKVITQTVQNSPMNLTTQEKPTLKLIRKEQPNSQLIKILESSTSASLITQPPPMNPPPPPPPPPLPTPATQTFQVCIQTTNEMQNPPNYSNTCAPEIIAPEALPPTQDQDTDARNKKPPTNGPQAKNCNPNLKEFRFSKVPTQDVQTPVTSNLELAQEPQNSTIASLPQSMNPMEQFQRIQHPEVAKKTMTARTTTQFSLNQSNAQEAPKKAPRVTKQQRLTAAQEAQRVATQQTQRLAAAQEAQKLAPAQEPQRVGNYQTQRLPAPQEAQRLVPAQEPQRVGNYHAQHVTAAPRLTPAQEAQRMTIHQTQRLTAAQEAQKLVPTQELLRVGNTQTQRLTAAQEAQRLVPAQEPQRVGNYQIQRLTAAQEAQLLTSAQETQRLIAGQETQRVTYQHTQRLPAAQEAQRLTAAQEAQRLIAAQEAQRVTIYQASPQMVQYQCNAQYQGPNSQYPGNAQFPNGLRVLPNPTQMQYMAAQRPIYADGVNRMCGGTVMAPPPNYGNAQAAAAAAVATAAAPPPRHLPPIRMLEFVLISNEHFAQRLYQHAFRYSIWRIKARNHVDEVKKVLTEDIFHEDVTAFRVYTEARSKAYGERMIRDIMRFEVINFNFPTLLEDLSQRFSNNLTKNRICLLLCAMVRPCKPLCTTPFTTIFYNMVTRTSDALEVKWRQRTFSTNQLLELSQQIRWLWKSYNTHPVAAAPSYSKAIASGSRAAPIRLLCEMTNSLPVVVAAPIAAPEAVAPPLTTPMVPPAAPPTATPVEAEAESPPVSPAFAEEEEDSVVDLTWIDDDLHEVYNDCKLFPLKIEEGAEGVTSRTSVSPVDSGLGSPMEVVKNDAFKCLCGKDAVYVCVCNTSMYCGPDCQRTDWEDHQNFCANMKS